MTPLPIPVVMPPCGQGKPLAPERSLGQGPRRGCVCVSAEAATLSLCPHFKIHCVATGTRSRPQQRVCDTPSTQGYMKDLNCCADATVFVQRICYFEFVERKGLLTYGFFATHRTSSRPGFWRDRSPNLDGTGVRAFQAIARHGWGRRSGR